jgi:pimeloyl-ACP methyl ester carboxylesterase
MVQFGQLNKEICLLLRVVRLLLRVLPNSLAFPLVRTLASRTQRPPIAATEREALSRATRISYGRGGRKVAWSWGAGPVVIFVHGWSGRAAQLAPLAASLSTQGFHSIAIEVRGHGSSPGNTTCWANFIQDVPELVAALKEEVFAVVGHSAGALAVAAARKLSSLSAKKYVFICAPSHPFPPLVLIKKLLNPRPLTLDAYKKYLADQFQSNWATLESGKSFAGLGAETLFVYDTADRFVPHTEGDKLASLCPNATLEKFDRYGHVGVLTAPELGTSVGRFLESHCQKALGSLGFWVANGRNSDESPRCPSCGISRHRSASKDLDQP